VRTSREGSPSDFHKDFHRFPVDKKAGIAKQKPGKTAFLMQFTRVYRRDTAVEQRYCSESARPAQQTERQQQNRAQQSEHTGQRDADNAERNGQEPHEGISNERQKRQRPT
jgi:hypothetical protein